MSVDTKNLRRLLSEATETPWIVDKWYVMDAGETLEIAQAHNPANAALIGTAINNLPALLDAYDERDRLKAENETLANAGAILVEVAKKRRAERDRLKAECERLQREFTCVNDLYRDEQNDGLRLKADNERLRQLLTDIRNEVGTCSCLEDYKLRGRRDPQCFYCNSFGLFESDLAALENKP